MLDRFVFLTTNVLFFIILSFIIVSLLLTITQRNPINAILFLISFFISIALLLIFCGADYLGILFLMLYAGAISIILLFVVMFLDLKDIMIQKEKFSYFVYFLLFTFCFFTAFEFILLFTKDLATYISFIEPHQNWAHNLNLKTNIEVIGIAFFNYYLFQFLILGVLLFLVMVLVIVLVIHTNLLSKKQNVSLQVLAPMISKWTN